MKKNKIMAGVLAMSMMAASTASLTANAATIPNIDTNFEYDLSVTKVSDSQLKLTLYTLNNPGLTVFSVGMIFDPAEFTCVDYEVSREFGEETTRGIGPNNEKGVFFIALAVNPDEITAEYEDYNGDFEISIWLNAKDGNVNDETYNFSTSVVDYQSKTEDIDVNLQDDDENILSMEHEIELQTVKYTYNIGNANLKNGIELADVSMINSLVAVANATGEAATVDNLNGLIEDGKSSTISSNNSTLYWGERFSDLLVTIEEAPTFACVEASDADLDGNIDSDDANAVADYYAAYTSNQDVSDFLVNTEMYKTITY